MKNKKEERGLFNERDDISKICATCTFSKKLSIGDYICSKYGVVSEDYSCKKYFLNRFMEQPKKQSLDFSRFSIDDFSID